MFGKSKSSRFEGPGSYLPHSARGEENVPTLSNVNQTPSNHAVKTKPRMTPRRDDNSSCSGGLPSYMLPTSASSSKKAETRSAKKDRLKFQTGEGADSLGPMQEFGKDARGQTPMRSSKHGRFSSAHSYFVSQKTDGADYVGLSHEQKNAVDKPKSTVSMKGGKGDRFGKGSYLEEYMSKPNSETMMGHQEFVAGPQGGAGTSSFLGKSGRDEWVSENSSMRDKDLSQCEGRHRLIDARSEFTNTREQKPTSSFTDTTHRFKDNQIEPGQETLGVLKKSDFEGSKKHPCVYKKPTSHGRFSEIGGLYYQK